MLEGKYANNFYVSVDSDADEAVITFSQSLHTQRECDTGMSEAVDRIDVAKVVMSVQSAKVLVGILDDCIRRSENHGSN